MDKELQVVSKAQFWASFLWSIRLFTITPSTCFFLWAFRLHHHKFKRGVLEILLALKLFSHSAIGSAHANLVYFKENYVYSTLILAGVQDQPSFHTAEWHEGPGAMLSRWKWQSERRSTSRNMEQDLFWVSKCTKLIVLPTYEGAAKLPTAVMSKQHFCSKHYHRCWGFALALRWRRNRALPEFSSTPSRP